MTKPWLCPKRSWGYSQWFWHHLGPIILNCAPNKKQSIFVLYTQWKWKIYAKFESIFHFDGRFTKLIIINANGAGSLQLSRNNRAKTLTRASMWLWSEEQNTRPTPIDYALGIVILAGIVKIMPALLTNQMTGIFRWCHEV